MPAPVDLLNRVFGELTVIERLEKLIKGYRYRWRCRCSCGRICDVPQHNLPTSAANIKHRGTSIATACDVCRFTRRCEACGETFYSRQDKRYCSKDCKKVLEQQRWRDDYRKRAAADPDFNRRRAQQVRERAASDPVFAARLAEYGRRQCEKRRERRKIDPEFREALNRQSRELYRKHADKILARRRQRRALRTPEERKQFRLRWLEKNRSYARAFREAIRRDPVKYRLYLERYKDANRKSYEKIMADPARRAARQKLQQERNRIAELNKLLQIDKKLSKQNDTDNS